MVMVVLVLSKPIPGSAALILALHKYVVMAYVVTTYMF